MGNEPTREQLDAEYERGRRAGITQVYDAEREGRGRVQPPAPEPPELLGWLCEWVVEGSGEADDPPGHDWEFRLRTEGEPTKADGFDKVTPLYALTGVTDTQRSSSVQQLRDRIRAALPFAETVGDVRKIMDLVDQLVAAQPAAGWQPISTAPKDGTQFLAGAWVGDEWLVSTEKAIMFEGGVIADFGVALPHDEWTAATHWMPMPQPLPERSND